MPEPKPPRAPDWNTGRFDSAAVDAIKKQFADRQCLAIRVPVTVRPKKGDDRPTYFDVFVEQDTTMTRAEDHYIRQGITVSKIATLRERGFRGLVVVADEALSTLLGDSENPSHTEWLEKATKLKQRYDWGPYTVRLVRNALKRIVAQLLFVPEGRDEHLLKDIIFLEDESDTGPNFKERKGKKKPKPAPEPEDVPPIPPPARSPFVIQKITGGFRVTRNGKDTPSPIEIRFFP